MKDDDYEIRTGGNLLGKLIITPDYQIYWETKSNQRTERVLLKEFLGDIFRVLRKEKLLKSVLDCLIRTKTHSKSV